jgi:hypothetical protein
MRLRLLLTAGMLLAIACQRRQPPAEPALPLQALRVALSSESELRKLGPAGDDAVRRPWIGPIVQVLVEATPDGDHPLARQRIAGSAATADALFERALANLRAESPQSIMERTVAVAKTNVQITRFGGDYTAARLLFPELWSKIAADGGGHLFAAAPTRDILLWTTSLAESDQGALRRQARIAFQSRSYPISTAILRWTGSGWTLEDANPVVPVP